jgi:pachytene checkpoint protein 2
MERNMTALPDFNRPKGIQRIRALPDPALGKLWDSIIIEGPLKEQLLSQAMPQLYHSRKGGS